MPEIVSELKVDRSGSDGWAREYVVRRDDGDQVHVRIECSGTADAVGRHIPAVRRVAADQGRTVALEQAQNVQPGRGARVIVLCRAFGVFADVRYGRRLAA